MSILQLNSVSQMKNTTPILQKLSVSIPKGRVSVILGKSGSGKSTLLRLLNGLDSPTEGEVLYKGKDVASYPPTRLRREVGMILQVPVMFESTVFENIVIGPRLLSRHQGDADMTEKELEERCLQLLDFVGLDPSFFRKKAAELSVGEQQRVAIARALANRPKVLLMDEPSSALDRHSTQAIEKLITKLRDEGTTLVVVTHNLGQARRLADFVLVLEEGELTEQGPPSEVFTQLKEKEFYGECCHDGH